MTHSTCINMHHETDWKMYQNARKSNVGPLSECSRNPTLLSDMPGALPWSQGPAQDRRIPGGGGTWEGCELHGFGWAEGLRSGSDGHGSPRDQPGRLLGGDMRGGDVLMMSWWCLDDVMWCDVMWCDVMWCDKDEIRCNDMVHVVCIVVSWWEFGVMKCWHGGKVSVCTSPTSPNTPGILVGHRMMVWPGQALRPCPVGCEQVPCSIKSSANSWPGWDQQCWMRFRRLFIVGWWTSILHSPQACGRPAGTLARDGAEGW